MHGNTIINHWTYDSFNKRAFLTCSNRAVEQNNLKKNCFKKYAYKLGYYLLH